MDNLTGGAAGRGRRTGRRGGVHPRTPGQTAARGALLLFFLFCVILPVAAMFSRITPDAAREVLRSPRFLPALRSTLTTALTATALALLLSFGAAFAVERTNLHPKGLFRTLLVLPMLIPSVSHAFGLIALFGRNGLIASLFGVNFPLYGFGGIVAGSVLYAFPVSFLMFSSVLQSEDASPHRAAEVLGVPAHRRFLDLTLPYMRGTIVSAFFALFTMIVTDYGVPLMVGGRTATLSVLLYQKAAAGLDTSAGAFLGSLLLIPALLAFLIDFTKKERGAVGFVSEPFAPSRSRARDALAAAYSVLLCALVLLPVLSFLFMVFARKYPRDLTFTTAHISRALDRGALELLGSSLLYATLTAALGTALAVSLAYLTTRCRRTASSRALHLLSVLTMALPGLVLGLSYMIFFHSTPLYGTVTIVVLAGSVHFLSSPYLLMTNSLAKCNAHLEEVGASLGVPRLALLRDVILPKVKLPALECFVYFFVNCMMTISAVSFLAPPSPRPLSLMINQFADQRLPECAAFVSLLILAVNLALKVIEAAVLRRGERKK